MLLSTLFVVPKEVLHELTCDHDTIDIHVAAADGFAISTIHHHCDILQLFVPPYFAPDYYIDICPPQQSFAYHLIPLAFFSPEVFQKSHIRGPPVLPISSIGLL